MCVYFTWYDWFTLVLGVVGSLLCVYLFAINDFDIEKTLFKGEEND